MSNAEFMKLLASNWIVVSAAALVVGMLAGWMIGNYRGRRQGQPASERLTAFQENVRIDFEKVGQKVERITDLAREIADIARRGEKTSVKTKLAANADHQSRFIPPTQLSSPLGRERR